MCSIMGRVLVSTLFKVIPTPYCQIFLRTRAVRVNSVELQWGSPRKPKKSHASVQTYLIKSAGMASSKEFQTK